MTQCERVLRHLKERGEISQLTALEQYGIMRLSSRIADLKRDGHIISVSFKSGKNRYGERTQWAVYRLERARDAREQ